MKRRSDQAAPVGRAIRFMLISGVSFVGNLAITHGLTQYAAWPAELAFAAALVIILFVNFACCRWFVFQASGQPIATQLASFLTATICFRGLEYAAFLGLHSLLEIHYLIATATVLIAGFAAKFLFYNRFVFGRPSTASP
ncbi:GtrA-like protein [Rosistilla ulvae]|uniref:GtrA-like protein n=1 Tax=Rosistilla ulvae TaxID=1930277 RepID=A0A517LVN1_9BACT|nr:GtrA family protein [Rosistilla ulvae]QDS86669.1 GtrA-like protein [Rosistilla ulvae]